MLEPYYDSYTAMIQMAGGVRRPVTLRSPDFRLDLDELRAAVTPRTRFVLLNSPHNPTGTVLTARRAAGRRRPGDRARPRRDHRRGLRAPRVRRPRARPDRDPAGDVRAHADAVERREVLLVHRLEGRLGDRTGRARRRRARRQAVADLHVGLAAAAGRRVRPRRGARLPRRAGRRPAGRAATCCAPGWPWSASTVRAPEGTYFATTDISALGWTDGLAFCRALPERAGVVAIPTQGFYDSDAGRQLVRWAFCKQPDVIEEGLRRLAGADLSR